jgi:hypothetical protein
MGEATPKSRQTLDINMRWHQDPIRPRGVGFLLVRGSILIALDCRKDHTEREKEA